MNKISLTTKYNKNMVPCIIFGDWGWNFIFVDTKNNQCVRSEKATIAWLKRNKITAGEFTRHAWNMYDTMKDSGMTCGLISYFEKDDDTVYNYSKTIDVEESYNDIFCW